MPKPTQDMMDNPQREQPGKPKYEDTTAEDASNKKKAPFSPFEDQPEYINWKARYGEYR